ncbi:hypothetical protein B0675_40020 [Streptomyces sp. M41(2017)]|uniref:hypothetical protein n=1 Tax=Streptomyces sp. M41(2017) TaxID=1955065 RepID=UPI0009C071AE|nr:hypothetical protein [Streptomyces sp. M41(2017)]OQQ13007.1 hypothetical protein B0675_40020 [Streptomyces sp. M41(2017)]
MSVAQGCTLPQTESPSTADLLDTPLPQLLADLGAVLVESGITEYGFSGYAHREGGRLLLAMRRGQPALERDCVARALLGNALGVPMPELPEPFRVSDLATL